MLDLWSKYDSFKRIFSLPELRAHGGNTMSRILTDEELISVTKSRNYLDSAVEAAKYMQAKTANYYESVVIPERDRTLIEEIETNMFFFDHEGGTMGLVSSGNKSYQFWQQLKKRGK
jgi:hypothetical protein